MLSRYLKPGIALLLVLLVLLLLWRGSRKARKAAAANDALLDAMLLEQLAPLPATEITGEIPVIAGSARRNSGLSVQDIVDNQTDEVASVLRDWLHQS